MSDPGLTPQQLNLIRERVEQIPEIELVHIFGSRAMGNYNPGSDVDIAVKGKHITEEIVRALNTRLNEELPRPHFFDVVHYNTLENESLIEQIDQNGIPL